MSEVTENGGPLVAGNTVATLTSTDVLDAAFSPLGNPFAGLPSAADLDAVAEEQAAKEATAEPETATLVETVPGDSELENTFDVSRAEFTELQDAFIRQFEAIQRFNANSPHKIQ
jgi:hypothetical protein